jgi:hypothetical protein
MRPQCFLLVLFVALTSLLPQPAAAQDTTGVGAIVGVVLSPGGQPSPNARVCALGTSACATTDVEGRFRLSDLRAGAYKLEVIPAEGLPLVSESIEVRAGLEGAVEIALSALNAIEQSITVTAPAFEAPEEVKSSAFLVAPLEIRKSAGALQDVSRFVQSLPGVVIGTNDFRNDIIVRGGSPLENLFIVDNVEIPNINTFANFASAGGTVSILDAEVLQDVTFLTGGYPAAYGNRTSSVLQVTQREGDREEFRGWATLGFAGAGTILEGPIADGKGSWIVSIRRTFLDVVTDDIGIGGVPVLYTLNGKVVYDLSPSDRIWLVNVSGRDNIRLGLTESTDLEEEELANFDIRYKGWRSGTGFNWQRLFSKGVGLLGVTNAQADVGQQVKDLVFDDPSPAGPVDDIIATSPVVYAESSRERETTVKYDLTMYMPVVEKIQMGGNVRWVRAEYDVDSPYGNDIPFSQEPNLDPIRINESVSTYHAAAYVQGTKELTRRFNITLGARYDRYAYTEHSRLSPRLSVAYRLTPTLTASASGGLYYQQPAFLFLTIFPENRFLAPWRAAHAVAGVAWNRSPDLRLTVEGYWKRYSQYPVASELPSVSLANIGDTFDVRQLLFKLTASGRGEAAGGEVYVEKRLTSRLYGQANLAVSRTRHAGLDGILRPGSFDYQVTFSVTGGYRFTPKWQASTRIAYLSGRPYTPYDSAISTAQRRGVYDLDRVNAQRAPAYSRIDVRVDRSFTVGTGTLNVFGGVQNLFNRQNVGGYSWNRRTNTQQLNEQQGIFPLLGLDWQF